MLVVSFEQCKGLDCPQCNPTQNVDTQAPMTPNDASLAEWEKELAEEVIKRAAFAKKPGNREREAMFRALIAVEKAMAELPKGHGQVAGFLQGRSYAGGTHGGSNALADYLNQKVRDQLRWSASLGEDPPKVTVFAESNGTIIESGRYMFALDPAPWQEMFMLRLRQGDFPELIEGGL